MRSISVPGVRLNFLDEGTGEPLVFVHGFPLDHTMWQPQIDHFRASHRVIAPDLRGFGKSGVTPGRVTMDQFADDIVSLLDAAGVPGPVNLCGLSMGGYIALSMVARYPQRIRRLILCDTRSIGETPEAAEGRRKLAAKVLELGPQVVAEAMAERLLAPETRARSPEILDRLIATILKTDREGIAAASHGMADRPDRTADLAKIKAPTLVLVGEHDIISPAEEMRVLSTRIPNARFVLIRDAGHMAPLEKPEVANEAIALFLRS